MVMVMPQVSARLEGVRDCNCHKIRIGDCIRMKFIGHATNQVFAV